jgi:hypothetical protein
LRAVVAHHHPHAATMNIIDTWHTFLVIRANELDIDDVAIGVRHDCSVVMRKPADGATVSSSNAPNIASSAADRALPASVSSSANISSRLATSPPAITGMGPNTFLLRGSMRGSSVTLEAKVRVLLRWLLGGNRPNRQFDTREL